MIRQIEESKTTRCTTAAHAQENGHNIIPPAGVFFYD